MTSEPLSDDGFPSADEFVNTASLKTTISTERRHKGLSFKNDLLLKRLIYTLTGLGILIPTVLSIVLMLKISDMAIRINSLEAAFRSGQLGQLSSSVVTLEKRVANQEQHFALKDDVSAGMKTLSEQESSQSNKIDQLARDTAENRQAILRQGAQLGALQTRADETQTHLDALTELKTKSDKTAATSSPAVSSEKKRKPSSVKKHLRSARTVPLAAPFILTGIERRGGQVFAVVAPRGATSLSQMQLLSPGDSAWGWTLHSTQGNEALFSVNGTQQRLTAQ